MKEMASDSKENKGTNHSSETASLLPESTKTFVVAQSFWEEIQLTFKRCVLLSFQMLAFLGASIVAIVLVGQLEDDALYLSGVGLSRMFTNVTGTAMAWGFTTSLFTLLPQVIGKGCGDDQIKLVSIYIQQSFYVTTVVSILLSFIQFYAGNIMIGIGQPSELYPIISKYCRLLIPYIFFVSYSSILQRLLQALDINKHLLYCCIFSWCTVYPISYFFMFYLNYGVWGAAIGQICFVVIYTFSISFVVVIKGYGKVFIPLPLSIVCTGNGLWDYIKLAIPGLMQNAFTWIIEEMATLLSGYIDQSNPKKTETAIASTVILINLFLVVVSFAVGVCNATNLRVAKYIGAGNTRLAKRAAKAGILIAFGLAICIILIFGFGRNIIPQIYTNNTDVIQLCIDVFPLMILYSVGCVTIQVFGGIYRGLGFQKMSAIFIFISYWIISFPVSMVLLFGFDYKNDLVLGTQIIWGYLAVGNILADIGCILYLIFAVDWKKAVKQSHKRINDTVNNFTKSYQSMNKGDSRLIKINSIGPLID